jgi:hypothetical protein
MNSQVRKSQAGGQKVQHPSEEDVMAFPAKGAMRLTLFVVLALLPAGAYGLDDAKKAQAKGPVPKEPALREELLDLQKEDQEVRGEVLKELADMGITYGAKKTIKDPAKVKALLAPTRRLSDMDQKHVTRLNEILKKYGWPGKTLVGKDGAHAAFFLVLQAEKEVALQKRCLKLMKAAPKGEVESEDIAYLTDRVLVADKKKQLYGTQLQVKGGKFMPLPIENEANVDKRRAEMGMSTLEEYLDVAQEQYEKAAGKKKK